MNRTNARTRRNGNGVNIITLKEPSEFDRLDKLIRQGPATLILVHSTSCPHCVEYMPTWKNLQKTPNRKTNMVTVEASVFDQTPLSEKKSINSVPAVLYVDPAGEITEVSDIRNATNMQQILKTGTNINATANIAQMDSEDLMKLVDEVGSKDLPERSISLPPLPPAIANMSEPNPLPALPTDQMKLSQAGGNPFAAALLSTVGPTALLAGAYSALPMRSSGLLAPRHSAKWKRIKRRILHSRKQKCTRNRCRTRKHRY